jgi:hypothetical protein
MADNNYYTMARHALEDIQKTKGEITVEDAMYILYQSIDIVIRRMDNAFRNQAAIAAMQGMIAKGWAVSESETVAQNAFDFADAMLEEVKKQ